ncbi:DUF3997 domain-containing protein [Salipaludibacillus sp. LMS25]|jgi:hypothetical protein|uniref:DUF3997 domain-containing protein n=1 Tax=Salipaludibacillus sp. LMS25 TaxID=2924031 RepID=UPI0020D06E6F|nr:DUF3997 domain-containing protein [Salipaludibacillus sp. LMS25]UTR16887.1 DUF3997 domain-containing protein [Salipaludibacillus sp. LMS25]
MKRVIKLKGIKITTVLLSGLLLTTSCAGLSNTETVIGENYTFGNESQHNVFLYYDENKDGVGDSAIVPAKLVKLNWDDHVIIAQQEKLSSGEPTGQYRYWIEDRDNRELIGANLTLQEFEELKKSLNINLELKELSEF